MFWYQNSVLARLIQRWDVPRAKEQEKQEERDAKISRVEVFPKDVEVDLGDEVRFAAVAYDDEDNAIGGVRFNWKGEAAGKEQRVRISQRGLFEAMTPGTFNIIARAAGKSAQVSVTVRNTPRRNLNEQPYDGKFVRVIGFVSVEFEGTAVYLHQEDYKFDITQNAIWLDMDFERNKKLNQRYVLIEGTFDANHNGHKGLFSGSIKDIKRLQVWP